jgi:hypothetical protein
MTHNFRLPGFAFAQPTTADNIIIGGGGGSPWALCDIPLLTPSLKGLTLSKFKRKFIVFLSLLRRVYLITAERIYYHFHHATVGYILSDVDNDILDYRL